MDSFHVLDYSLFERVAKSTKRESYLSARCFRIWCSILVDRRYFLGGSYTGTRYFICNLLVRNFSIHFIYSLRVGWLFLGKRNGGDSSGGS